MSGREGADHPPGRKGSSEREIPSPTKSPRAKRSRQESDATDCGSSLIHDTNTIPATSTHGDVEEGETQRPRSDTIDIPSTSRERQRTPTLLDDKLPLWIAGYSPAKFISIDELMKMNDSLEKMAIIHEIAVNPKFSVEDLKQGNDVYEAVKKNMHQAYWDLLRDKLRDKSEEFHTKQAFPLLADLKGMLMELLSEENLTNARTAIGDILDMDRIRTLLGRQNAEAGSDLLEVLQMVLRVLKHLCAPVRDDLVESLLAEEDLITLFKGLFDLAEKMRVDLANYALTANRNLIESYSERMEREEFEKIMQIDKEATRHTKLRLKHLLDEQLCNDDDDGKEELSGTEVKRIIISLYVDILLEKSGDRAKELRPEFSFPETLKLDESRLSSLGEKFLQLILTAGAVIVAASVAGQEAMERHSDFKATLKMELILILNDVTACNQLDRLNAVALQCEKHLKGVCGEKWDEKQEGATFRGQILSLADPENRIRTITKNRLLDFIRQALGRTGERLQIPPGLGMIQPELAAFTSRFCALATHNWNTFGTLYGTLLEELWKERCGVGGSGSRG